MAEWREYSLGELVHNHNSARRPVKANERTPGETPYYGASGVVDRVEGFTHDGEFLLVSEDGENLKSRLTPIAFTATGRIWVNNHAHVLAGREPHDTRFLQYALSVTDISGYLTGSAQPKLSKAAMESIRLWLPDSVTRNAIADVLGALDDKITANESASSKSRELARSQFLRAAIEGEVVTIRNVAKLVTRGIAPKYVETDGMTVLNQKCVRDQRINLTPSRLTNESTVRIEKLLQRDDVLVNSTGAGTLGRIARWTHKIRATVDSHITIVRFDPDLIDPVCAGFGLLQIEKEVEGLAEGSTGQTELRRDLLAGLEIAVPHKGQQSAIGADLCALEELSLGLQQESDRLAATRDELLPLLMSGKIRVREAEKIVEGVV